MVVTAGSGGVAVTAGVAATRSGMLGNLQRQGSKVRLRLGDSSGRTAGEVDSRMRLQEGGHGQAGMASDDATVAAVATVTSALWRGRGRGRQG